MVDNELVTDIKTKANIFNEYFADQTFLTQSKLTSLDVNQEEIVNIIRALKIHKAHSHDDISIRMIKICDKSLLKPLIPLFQNFS